MNKVILIGNLTKDPELRSTSTGKSVTKASIATSETYADKNGQRQQKSEFHNLVLWGRPAEIFAQYLTKGKKVSIVGKIITDKYQAKDGTTKYVTQILVSEFEFLSPAGQQNQQRQDTSNLPMIDITDDGQMISVNDIPF